MATALAVTWAQTTMVAMTSMPPTSSTVSTSASNMLAASACHPGLGMATASTTTEPAHPAMRVLSPTSVTEDGG